MPPQWQFDLVSQVVDRERRLDSLPFRQHGCIYYRADLEAKGLLAKSLTEASSSKRGYLAEKDASYLARFSLGPLTKAVLWEGEREEMALDREPCRCSCRK